MRTTCRKKKTGRYKRIDNLIHWLWTRLNILFYIFPTWTGCELLVNVCHSLVEHLSYVVSIWSHIHIYLNGLACCWQPTIFIHRQGSTLVLTSVYSTTQYTQSTSQNSIEKYYSRFLKEILIGRCLRLCLCWCFCVCWQSFSLNWHNQNVEQNFVYRNSQFVNAATHTDKLCHGNFSKKRMNQLICMKHFMNEE